MPGEPYRWRVPPPRRSSHPLCYLEGTCGCAHRPAGAFKFVPPSIDRPREWRRAAATLCSGGGSGNGRCWLCDDGRDCGGGGGRREGWLREGWRWWGCGGGRLLKSSGCDAASGGGRQRRWRRRRRTTSLWTQPPQLQPTGQSTRPRNAHASAWLRGVWQQPVHMCGWRRRCRSAAAPHAAVWKPSRMEPCARRCP